MITRSICLFLFMLAVASGCSKLDPNPELKDPIYQDFLSSAEKAKKDIEAKRKDLDAKKENLSEIPDDSYEKKLIRDEIFNGEREIEKLEQKEKYYRISAESRQIYDMKKNLEAFKLGKKWSPQESGEEYFENKRLQETPRAWTRGLASTHPSKKVEKKESGAEE